jgi:hypothetical protein
MVDRGAPVAANRTYSLLKHLRRTAASFMTKLGILRLHVEEVLNHATGDIAEVYDRHDYLPEKRAALERWSVHLKELLAGNERPVVPLQRRARH